VAEIAAAHHGSSAQLRLRLLNRYASPAATIDDHAARWIARHTWHRDITTGAQPRQLMLRLDITNEVEAVELSLCMTGDGEARFSDVRLQDRNGECGKD
jgi:hypothetical protein